MSEPTRTPRSRLIWRLVVAAAVVAGLALIGVGVWRMLTPAQAAPPPERHAVDDDAIAAEPVPQAEPERLRIPVIDFAADVRGLAVDDSGVIRPPTVDAAYWLEDYGLAGSDATETVYLAGHSSAAGTSVFDPLVDRAQDASTLQVGDELLVDTEEGTVVYLVQALKRYDKTELPDIDDLWTTSPGRLVLITCYYEQGATSAPDNFVVYARLAPGAQQ